MFLCLKKHFWNFPPGISIKSHLQNTPACRCGMVTITATSFLWLRSHQACIKSPKLPSLTLNGTLALPQVLDIPYPSSLIYSPSLMLLTQPSYPKALYNTCYFLCLCEFPLFFLMTGSFFYSQCCSSVGLPNLNYNLLPSINIPSPITVSSTLLYELHCLFMDILLKYQSLLEYKGSNLCFTYLCILEIKVQNFVLLYLCIFSTKPLISTQLRY